MSVAPLKIVFMGTPDFSAEVFRALNAKYPVAAVVTGTDKPSGRKMEPKPCALKVAALESGIKVLQFDKVSKEGIADIRALAPDVVVTAAFGQILSDEFLSIPKFGVLNVHASLLPKYRGSSPIQAALLSGDKTTGVTIMRTVKAVDAGDILLKIEIEISPDDTAGTLFDRLATVGGEGIVEAIASLTDGTAVFTPQNDAEATHCSKIDKEFGLISWDKTPRELDLFVRAMQPWPSAYCYLDGKLLKVVKVAETKNSLDRITNELNIVTNELKVIPGTVIRADKELHVACKDGSVRLTVIKPESGAEQTDTAYLNGHKISVGTLLK